MKRSMSVLFAALLVFMVAGQAAAIFEESHLVRVVYKSGGTEIATDLGTVSSALSGISGNGALQIKLSDFGASSWGDLNVAYFAFTNSGGGKIWASDVIDSPETAPVNGGSGAGTTFRNDYNNIISAYKNASPTAKSQITTGTTNSYNKVFNPVGDYGILGYFNDFYVSGFGEANLGDLVNGTAVGLNLYSWTLTAVNAAGKLEGFIRTELDGASGVARTFGAAVPVPAAVWLLGTGLIGLVGIRRRKTQ